MIIVRKAGKPSVASEKSTSLIVRIIKNPTIIKAEAVACGGIKRKSGEKKRDSKKSAETVTAVRPVLPPTATPEVLST